MKLKKMFASVAAAVMLMGAVSMTSVLPDPFGLTADAIEYDVYGLYVVNHVVRGVYKYQSSVYIPDDITSINAGAFTGCTELRNIYIGKGVRGITANFSNCTNLEEIMVDPDNANFSSEDGVLFNKIGTELIAYPMAKEDKSYSVPYYVEKIRANAFSGNKNLTDVYLSIVETANGFSGCPNLKTVSITEYTTRIAANAFLDCPSLTTIDVYPTNPKFTSVDGVLFSNDGTRLIQYPIGKTDTKYTVPEGVIEIGEKAFSGSTKLENIELPSSLSIIGNEAFTYCAKLTSIDLPNELSIIGNNAFSGCSKLKELILPEGMNEIGNEAFSNCSGLTSVEIKNGLEKIGNRAFSNCKGIKNITLPESVTEIGDNVFVDCTSLSSATIYGDPKFGESIFKPGVMLYGMKGSSVEQYAKDNSDLLYGFSPITTVMRGDANEDGVISLSDVTDILKHYVGIKKLPDSALENADANADGKINIDDVTYTLKLFVGIL